MTTLRPFQATDILRFNNVNSDAWTATYHTGYYATYAATWPDFCVTAENASTSGSKASPEASTSRGGIHAYMIAKHEPPPPDPQHHGHLTALSICPTARGTGLARVLMDVLESLSGSKVRSEFISVSAELSSSDTNVKTAEGEKSDATDPTTHPVVGKEPKPNPRSNPDAVDAWFVDLFVRCNNGRAVEMYEKMGYSVFRRVVDYYHGMKGVGSSRDELDGFDMRKSMPRDTAKRFVRDNGKDILVSPEQVWA